LRDDDSTGTGSLPLDLSKPLAEGSVDALGEGSIETNNSSLQDIDMSMSMYKDKPVPIGLYDDVFDGQFS
jgi:hypothetical protein